MTDTHSTQSNKPRLLSGRRLVLLASVAGVGAALLLAGPSGKIWSDRFELDEFPGIRGFIAALMEVPFDDVEVLSI